MTRHGYDGHGRLSSATHPSGAAVTYAYNPRGYLESVSSGATTLVRRRSADAWGNTTGAAYGNGVGTVRGFDAATGRLESVRTTRGTGAAAAVLQSNAYAWRSDGSLHSRAGAQTETFAYDHLNRLTEARTELAADRVLSYAYSARGDLESKTDSASAGRSATAYGYDRTDRRLDSVTVGGAAWTLHHDDAGHVTRYERPGDDRFVSWDGRGLATEVRLASSATATSTARDAFAYGPDGARRHRRSEWSGKTEDTYYAGAYEKTYRADGSVVERTRLGAAVHVRTTPAGGGAASSSWEYPHRDHLGSVESVTDSAGAELVVLAHDPYGDRRRPDWTGRLTAASSTALLAAQGRRASRGFTGHEHLDRTGLVHMNGRVYDPLLGRFLSPDPVVSGPAGSQGWALYGYVGNNPLSRTDPTGMVVAGSCGAPGSNCVNFAGGGPPGGGARTVTVSSLQRVFGVQVLRTLTAGLAWGRDGRVTVGYGWRTRVRPFGGLVRTVRHLVVADESPADEPVEPNWTERDRTSAELARQVYHDDDGGLLGSLGIEYDPDDGFAAALYERDGQYYLAFRGSEDELADWKTNGAQALGLRASQYEQAIRLAQRVLELTGRDLTVVGHSLGGGLASAVSSATGVRAVTFNAAGLSSAYGPGRYGLIRAHHIRGDFLSGLQDAPTWIMGFDLPSAARRRIPHDSRSGGSGLHRHSIDRFLEFP